MIRNVSEPNQWRYIDTAINPADLATRCVAAAKLTESRWIKEFLWDASLLSAHTLGEMTLDENNPEIRKEVAVHATDVHMAQGLGCERFNRFSKWSSLKRALASLIVKAKDFKQKQCQAQIRERLENQPHIPSVAELKQAANVIIKEIQREQFSDEFEKLGPSLIPNCKEGVMRKSNLFSLDLFIDTDGVLRVGGRLRRPELDYQEKHLALLPKGHHVSELIVRHYHECPSPRSPDHSIKHCSTSRFLGRRRSSIDSKATQLLCDV